MRVVPVYFTSSAETARRFFSALGLETSWVADSGTWVSMVGSGGGVGLHDAGSGEPPRPAGAIELSFESDEPLEQVATRLTDAGFEATIVDESFGRSLRTIDPDGQHLQINEVLSDSYGYSKA